MKIGMDIDGVISDFVTSFRKVVKKERGIDLKYCDIHQHDLHKVLGLEKDETYKLVDKTFRYELGFQHGAIDGINELFLDHEIILITSRSPKIEKITKDWLQNNNIRYDDIIFTKAGEKCQENKHCLDVIIDDHLKEINNCIDIVPNVLVYDHPWNQSDNASDRFHRVFSWEDILDHLEQLNKKSGVSI